MNKKTKAKRENLKIFFGKEIKSILKTMNKDGKGQKVSDILLWLESLHKNKLMLLYLNRVSFEEISTEQVDKTIEYLKTYNSKCYIQTILNNF